MRIRSFGVAALVVLSAIWLPAAASASSSEGAVLEKASGCTAYAEFGVEVCIEVRFIVQQVTTPSGRSVFVSHYRLGETDIRQDGITSDYRLRAFEVQVADTDSAQVNHYSGHAEFTSPTEHCTKWYRFQIANGELLFQDGGSVCDSVL